MNASTNGCASYLPDTIAKRPDTRSCRFYKNGVLLAAAEAAGFEVIVTTDREIPYQQNLKLRRICILVLCAPHQPARRFGAFDARRFAGLDTLEAGQVMRID